MLVAGIGLLFWGTPSWWLGGALVWGAISLVRHSGYRPWEPAITRLAAPRVTRFGTLRPSAALLESFYVALIVATAVTMLWDVFVGERPVSHDHTVHYFKAFQLHQDFLPRGRLFGWSSRMFAGYPVNYLYPIGADLWVNLCHALSFGMLSFSRAYGLAFVAFFVLLGLSGYRFGRSLGGPHVGVLTGLLLLTDLSDFRLGGWAYTVEFGVWPQALGLAFALLALSHLPDIVQGQRVRPVAAFGLWMGLSALTHPMVLVFVGLIVPLFIIASMLADNTSTLRAFLRLLLGCLIATPIACTWLIPFFDTRKYTSAMGVFWDTTYDMGRGLVDLTTLKGTLGYVTVFGILALVVCLRSRQFRWIFCALCALAVPLLCSSTFVDELHLANISAAFTKIQFLRMATMIKPFWFALASMFFVTFLRMLPTWVQRMDQALPTSSSASLWRSTLLSMLIAFVCLPLIVPAGQAFYVDHVRKSLRHVDDREYQQDRQALRAYLLENLPRDGFYRLGISMGHNHELIDLATELNVPIFKRGFTPCENFIYKMQSEEQEIYDAVKVRYMISKQAPKVAGFELIKRFGIYGLYRYTRYTPEPYVVDEGKAQVRMRHFESERVAFDVAAGASGRIRLPISWFPRWHAYRDGKRLQMTRIHLNSEPEHTGFMSVPLAAGHYEFRFERTLADMLAVPIGLAGLLLALALMLSAKLDAVVQRGIATVAGLELRLPKRATHSAGLVVLAALLLVFVALSKWRPVLKLDQDGDAQPARQVRFDLIDGFSDATAAVRFRDRTRACRRVGDELMCPDDQGQFSSDRYVGSQPTTIEEYRMVRCLRARPQQASILLINYDDVPRGKRLIGYYGMDYEGRLLFYKRPVNFQISVDGQELYGAQTERDNHMHEFSLPVPAGGNTTSIHFAISAPNPYKRWFCFYAQVID